MSTVFVPDIGDYADVPVIEIHVRPGDMVKAEDALITLESDKATMEIPSPHTGIVKFIAVKIGDKVTAGSPILELEASASATTETIKPTPVASSTPAAPSTPATAATALPVAPSAPAAPSIAQQPGGVSYASPSVRLLARELGVVISLVKGSGPKDRILQSDVKNYVKATLSSTKSTAGAPTGSSGGELNLLPWPKVDFAKFGPVTSVPLSRIKKLSGPNLARNWVMIPAVTYHEDADITELESFRVQLNKENEKSGIKLTMLAFIIKAIVSVLKKYPDLNSSLLGEELIVKQYWHIGFAADTPNGLVVPVLKNVDQKGVMEISNELGELSLKARAGKLSPAEMQGASFTCSSLGGIGGTYFSPIVNAPEVAILGVNKAVVKPVWDGKAFVPRLMLPLSLSADHRVIDGALASRFNASLATLLNDFRRISL